MKLKHIIKDHENKNFNFYHYTIITVINLINNKDIVNK
jgi:hypothetical protein